MNCRHRSREYLIANRVPKDEEDIGCAMGDAGEYLEEMKKMEAEDLGRKEARFSAKTNL